jgi:hypothetical protein
MIGAIRISLASGFQVCNTTPFPNESFGGLAHTEAVKFIEPKGEQKDLSMLRQAWADHRKELAGGGSFLVLELGTHKDYRADQPGA